MGAGGDDILPPVYDGPVAVLDLVDVVAAIMAQPARGRARIVGVDGPSGSGKSTLARRLAAQVEGAIVVKIDDFVAWDDLTEWWPRFDAQVLTPLLAGRTARYQVRSKHRREGGFTSTLRLGPANKRFQDQVRCHSLPDDSMVNPHFENVEDLHHD